MGHHQQLYWSHLRKFCQASILAVCSYPHGLTRKYGPNMCCHCFHQYEKDMGFIKLG
ncbi:small ribosomal subunit protein uS14-like [Oryctolagus cuniculus]|uniref:small ribosomal subunit protein uS14-like n=1 Tax=Oryctolagus cuniculus TaxID=9986 RepID=UPI0001CE2E8E|nr:40S ribosomal protein S29-like [Oryctolagus cuniculus]